MLRHLSAICMPLGNESVPSDEEADADVAVSSCCAAEDPVQVAPDERECPPFARALEFWKQGAFLI